MEFGKIDIKLIYTEGELIDLAVRIAKKELIELEDLEKFGLKRMIVRRFYRSGWIEDEIFDRDEGYYTDTVSYVDPYLEEICQREGSCNDYTIKVYIY